MKRILHEGYLRNMNQSGFSRKRWLHAGRGKLVANLLVLTILLALIANTSAGIFAFAQTTAPVVGAFVTASGDNGFGSNTTNALGNYNITSGLGTGNYTVSASATGFIDATVGNLSVTAGNENSNVVINMNVSGGIAGRISDAVSNSSVQFATVTAANRTGSVDYGSTNSTALDGTYRIITNLATGRYNVTANAAGYLTRTITNISVIAGVLTSNVGVALNRSAVISGTVTDNVSGVVLPGIFVYAVTSTGGFGASAIANSSGMYTLNTNLGTAIYNITTLFPANHTSVTISGLNVTAGNQYTQNISLPRSGIISGRITSPTGTGLSGATVTAVSTNGAFSGFATANSTGYYRITDGLGTANYTVSASYAGSFNTTTTAVSVTAGSETSNIDLQLTSTPSGTISGRVTNSTGSPIASITVSAIGAGGVGSGATTTDSNGTYTISTGLGTGTYNVSVSGAGFVAQTRTNVTVTVNQATPNINFQLQTAVSGRISGSVQTTATPIPEFHTELVMLAIFATASIVIMIKRSRSPSIKPTKPL